MFTQLANMTCMLVVAELPAFGKATITSSHAMLSGWANLQHMAWSSPFTTNRNPGAVDSALLGRVCPVDAFSDLIVPRVRVVQRGVWRGAGAATPWNSCC